MATGYFVGLRLANSRTQYLDLIYGIVDDQASGSASAFISLESERFLASVRSQPSGVLVAEFKPLDGELGMAFGHRLYLVNRLDDGRSIHVSGTELSDSTLHSGSQICIASSSTERTGVIRLDAGGALEYRCRSGLLSMDEANSLGSAGTQPKYLDGLV